MKRPSIKVALAGLSCGMFLISTAVSLTAVTSMMQIDVNNDAIVDDLLPSVSRSKEVNIAMANVRIAYRNHVLSANEAEEKAAEKQIEAAGSAFKSALESYATLVQPDATEEQAKLQNLRDDFGNYVKTGEELLALSRAGKDEEAKKVLSEKMGPFAKQTDEILDGIVSIKEERAHQAGKTNQDMLESALHWIYALSGLAFLVGLAVIFFALTNIATPISRITGAMRKLAEGDTESGIPFSGRSDEIGAMAGAVEVFRQSAIANKQLAQEAEASRKRAEADRIADQQQAEADAAARLKIATSGLAAGLQKLAAGDLSFQLNEAFAPEFEALRQDFNLSVKQLGNTLSAISASIVAIDSGSREISSSAQDLSKRTEHQASSLEETAAALEEITANVSNSTKRTEEARLAATQANGSATESVGVVGHAEEAMRRIEESSRQISNIIGVIDEIAFQTNLLALNAGVEAARAGDAGKGFAVVAQEVRELAQRSAQAAKEIKGLIQNSTSEVEGGVKLVRDTGIALKTIGEHISGINQHMQAIATSAKEQSTGLAEVNTAVNSMDQTTQQNAAMVEQSNAASASLALEAAKLRELVSQFKLEGATAQSSALRQTARTMAAPSRPAAAQYTPPPKKVAAAGGTVSQGDWEEF
jgi:methyl-accepting chemotaxis protein